MSAENVISAFSEEHAEALTGVSKNQLRYWDRTDFFKPSMAYENRRVAYSRIYSFKDIVSLRVLNILRNQYNVPLQHLRDVANNLAHLSDKKWTATELFVLSRRVVFVEPDTEKYREIVSNQYVIGLPLHIVVSDTRRDVEKLNVRGSDLIGTFERARYVNHNALVIAGTRIPVETIKQFGEDDYSVDQILTEYPSLTREDVEAALRHEDNRTAA